MATSREGRRYATVEKRHFRSCLIATATPREIPPIVRAGRAYAPVATAPPEWDFRWSPPARAHLIVVPATAIGSKRESERERRPRARSLRSGPSQLASVTEGG